MKLKFKLAPVTYVQVLDEIICAWNSFAERHSDLWSYKIGAKGRLFSSGSIYELMDVLFMGKDKLIQSPALTLTISSNSHLGFLGCF